MRSPVRSSRSRRGGRTLASDREGNFTIANLPPGDYEIKVSYVGFRSLATHVTVHAGQAAKVDIVLQVALTEEVNVTVDRPRGEAAAVNRQRTADNIVEVLPAEVITSLPNTNIADAVGRLPSVSLERDEGEGKYVQIRGTDPRLSNVTINDIHLPSPQSSARNARLDALPSDLVAAIELNKTLSANQDGDAIGGSVNLVTKTAGAEPYMSITSMGGYTPIEGGRGEDQFSATAGRRFGRDKKAGLLIGGTFDWNGRGIDDLEPGPGTQDFGNGPVFVESGYDMREYRYTRNRGGVGGGFDYRFSDNASMYVRGLYSRFQNYGDRWAYSPSAGDFITPTVAAANGTMALGVQNRRPDDQISSVSTGGVHSSGRVLVDYNVSFARGQERVLNQRQWNFSGPQNVAFGVDVSDPLVPRLNVLNGVNIYDPKLYTVTGGSLNNSLAAQRDLGGAFNLTVPYGSGHRAGMFAMGVKLRDSTVTQSANNVTLTATGAAPLTLDAVLDPFANPNFYAGKYVLGPLPSLDRITSFMNSNAGALTTDNGVTRQKSDPNNFDSTERVYASYLMNTIDSGRSRLQAGLRLEETDGGYTGQIVVSDAKGVYVSTSPTSGHHRYLSPLPSVQYRLALDANTNIRASYGMGIARPNFGDLPPFITENDKKATVNVGNPALKPTHANNLDLLLERFLEPVGTVEAGLFYKDLSDPIFEGFQSKVASGPYAGYTQTQPINGKSAHIFGIEAGWQEHLSFLPAGWRGLGVATNYSWTTSTAIVPNRSDNPPLARQAPNNWNAGVTYDARFISTRLGVTHNDASIYSYGFTDGADGGKTGPNGDTYLYAHTQMDAQATINLRRGLQVIVSGLNLTNEVFGFYNGSPQYTIQREFYNRTFSFGLRWVPKF